jgi:hypothetical protein
MALTNTMTTKFDKTIDYSCHSTEKKKDDIPSLIKFNNAYTSVSQHLWDRCPVNSFFIRRGPGPNKLSACRQFLWTVTNIPFPECWNIWMSENSRSLMNTSMFKNTWLGHWHLLHRCYLGVLGLSFLTHSWILVSSEYFDYKIFMKNA